MRPGTAAFAEYGGGDALAALGYNVFQSDLDVVWFDNPYPYLKTHFQNYSLVLQVRPLLGRYNPSFLKLLCLSSYLKYAFKFDCPIGPRIPAN